MKRPRCETGAVVGPLGVRTGAAALGQPHHDDGDNQLTVGGVLVTP